MPVCVSLALGGERTGDPEVGDLHLAAAVQEDVLRLDVAVDEALLVREVEAVGDRDRELDRSGRGQRALAGGELLQVLAGDVLEDDERPALVLAAVDHGDDVRMGKPCDELRLPPEAGDDVGVGSEPFVQDLDGDGWLKDPVVRAEHARHAAGADELFELVAVHDHARPPSMWFDLPPPAPQPTTAASTSSQAPSASFELHLGHSERHEDADAVPVDAAGDEQQPPLERRLGHALRRSPSPASSSPGRRRARIASIERSPRTSPISAQRSCQGR